MSYNHHQLRGDPNSFTLLVLSFESRTRFATAAIYKNMGYSSFFSSKCFHKTSFTLWEKLRQSREQTPPTDAQSLVCCYLVAKSFHEWNELCNRVVGWRYAETPVQVHVNPRGPDRPKRENKRTQDLVNFKIQHSGQTPHGPHEFWFTTELISTLNLGSNNERKTGINMKHSGFWENIELLCPTSTSYLLCVLWRCSHTQGQTNKARSEEVRESASGVVSH